MPDYLGHTLHDKSRKPASEETVFKEDGFQIIEKYCDVCLEPKEFERIQTIYSRIG